jgi:hypothetical protein
MGPPQRPLTGLGLRVADTKNLTPEDEKLKAALEAAKIPFDLLQGRYGQIELFLTAVKR